MKIKLLIGVGIAGAAMAYAAKDPVIMTVNGVDVPLSEFEYLYHKNSQQQVDPQPLSDYVEMFKVYKMKVADALACGIDTTSKFRSDMNQYRRELSEPYMADSAFIEKMAQEQYDRMKEEVEARHIMILKRGKLDELKAQRRLADSLHNVIVNGGNFEELAEQFSQDRMSQKKGGNMGFMTAGTLPYGFETTMYSLPEGQISDVVETGVGYHILKGGKRRPASGSVSASHILVMFNPQLGDNYRDVAKARADSLAKVVKADPSQFAEIARKYSDDKGSGMQGGALPRFTVGQMVPEFSDAAFALADGEISDPVRSQFGYHIIYKHDHEGLAPYSELRNKIITRVTNPQDGERKEARLLNDIDKLGKKHKLKINQPGIDWMLVGLDSCGGFTPEFEEAYIKHPKENPVLFTIGKKPYNLMNGRLYFALANRQPTDDGRKTIQKGLNAYMQAKLSDAERDYLYDHNEDYRNLLNEYRDGSLLYEVSLDKVWDKAAKDTEGLDKYFESHRADFKWTEPRVKGVLVKAINDSVANLVRERLPQVGMDTIVSTIRAEFGKNVQIDRVLVKKGDNQLVDYLIFDPENSQPPLSSNYPVYFMYNNEVIAEPREVEDVKGVVTAAYQDYLEQQWVDELRNKYPVTVNEKVLKKVK